MRWAFDTPGELIIKRKSTFPRAPLAEFSGTTKCPLIDSGRATRKIKPEKKKANETNLREKPT